MNKRTTLIVATLLVLFGLIGYRLYAPSAKNDGQNVPPAQEECDRETTTEDCKPISLDTSTWKVFENPAYGYAISYPIEGYSQSFDDYGTLEHTYFGIRGRFTLGGVDATVYPNYPLSDAQAARNLDLRSYAESIRMLQINYPNSNHKDRRVSDLEETTVDGRMAYRFTLDQGFTTMRQVGVGDAIPTGQTYRYVITETPQGQKLIIYYYMGNPIAEAMFRTFRFR